MTYESLFVAVNSLARQLPPAALRLLIHLIATGITEGTNELKISGYDLVKQTGMARDTIRAAANALASIMSITAERGQSYRFTMPDDWFNESRGLFTAFATVEKLANQPGNQATTSLESRLQLAWKPGYDQPGNQASSDQLAWKPGYNQPGNQASSDQTSLESRLPDTQNQQVTDAAASLDQSGLSGFSTVVEYKIDQIARVRQVPAHLLEQSSALCEALRAYARDCGNPRLSIEQPDEIILARSLAIAPLGDLLSLMRQLRNRGTQCGFTYAWFPEVFAQRLLRAKRGQLAAAYTRYKTAPPDRPQQSLEFTNGLVNEATSKVRRMA